MTEEIKENRERFSEDYVKELRAEAADWRVKFRELESTVGTKDVENELLKRGVEAEPQWVVKKDNQSVSDAVDSFLEKHPVFNPSEEVKTDESEQTIKPKFMQRKTQQSNVPGPKSNGSFTGKTSEEIKKDPKARQALARQYRQLLAQSSHREYSGE